MPDQMIERIFHVNVVVRDFDRSLAWYTDVLGMKIQEGPYRTSGPELAGIGVGAHMWGFKPDEVEIKFAFLKFGDSDDEVILDVLQFIKPQSWGAPPATLQHIGLARIALKVPDVDTAYETLLARGVVFQTELCPIDLGGGLLSGISYAVFHGPDGEFLEIYGPRGSTE